jgi:hypothetical protein
LRPTSLALGFTVHRLSFFWGGAVGVRLGATGLRTWCTSCRIRGGTWPIPYISCNFLCYSRTTRAVVKLVRIEGNYPSSTQVGLLSSYHARISM